VGPSQQETCNIYETGQDRTKVTTDDQYEVVYTRFRLVPKSTNLDDLEGHYAQLRMHSLSKHVRLWEPSTK